jgi:hypothetical protein
VSGSIAPGVPQPRVVGSWFGTGRTFNREFEEPRCGERGPSVASTSPACPKVSGAIAVRHLLTSPSAELPSRQLQAMMIPGLWCGLVSSSDRASRRVRDACSIHVRSTDASALTTVARTREMRIATTRPVVSFSRYDNCGPLSYQDTKTSRWTVGSSGPEPERHRARCSLRPGRSAMSRQHRFARIPSYDMDVSRSGC